MTFRSDRAEVEELRATRCLLREERDRLARMLAVERRACGQPRRRAPASGPEGAMMTRITIVITRSDSTTSVSDGDRLLGAVVLWPTGLWVWSTADSSGLADTRLEAERDLVAAAAAEQMGTP